MDNPSLSIFARISYDYLALLAKKTKMGEMSKTVGEEAGTLEWFYMEVERLLKMYDSKVHEFSLLLLQERMTSKLLESELVKLMMATTSKNEVDIQIAIERTNFDLSRLNLYTPVKHKMREPLTDEMFPSVKKKFSSGTKLSTILKHYVLSEDQLIKLIDVTK